MKSKKLQDEYETSACNEWLSEGRIIRCEMISDDGEHFSCAHCGRKPNEKPSSISEKKARRGGLILVNSKQKSAKPTSNFNLQEISDERSALKFITQNLGIRPNPEYRDDSGVNLNKSQGALTISVELDRFRRHDHGGGPDGDGWLEDHKIEQDYSEGVKKHKSSAEKATSALTDLGITSSVEFYLGEKGHFYLRIEITPAKT